MDERTRAEWLRLFGYMAASARGCVSEPKLYGPFRLVDSVSRIVDVLHTGAEDEPIFNELRNLIDDHKELVMTDTEAFVGFLDDLVVKIAEALKQSRL